MHLLTLLFVSLIFSVIEGTGGTGTPRGGRGLLGRGGRLSPPTFFQKMVLLEQVFALLLN